MNFTTLSFPAVVGGLLALAGVLYLLQRLRVRHKEQLVVTTLFWRQAVEETRARVLMHRFRHPWAYLLVLILASLLWLALAGPEGGRRHQGESFVLVDGTVVADLDALRVATDLDPLLEQLPRQRTTVWLVQRVPTALLLPGEHPSLLLPRLREVERARAPSHLEHALQLVAEGATEESPREVYLAGGSLPEGFLDLLPATVTLWRWPLGELTPPPPANRGVTALGVGAARSRRPDRVDALAVAQVAGDRPVGPVQVLLDGEPLPPERLAVSAGERRTRVEVRDLPAEGGRLEVRLAPERDLLPQDDAAEVLLPERAILDVALEGDVPTGFRRVLDVDPGLRPGGSAPVVVLRQGGPATQAALPALELLPWTDLDHAFEVVAPDARGEDLTRLLASLGLDQIDATGLAEETGRVIDVGLRSGPRRGLRVARELCQDTFNFTRSRAFPLFVAQSLRWLAGQPELLPEVASGRPLAGVRGPFQDAKGRSLDPLGDAFTPMDAGTFTTGDGRALAASWLDPVHTLGGHAAAEPLAAAPSEASWWPRPASLLMILALLGSLVEWYLYRTARIP